ncbi:MAG: hypothetical protein QXV32_04945 [Conexivisphaerales archaeon]
MPSAVLAAILIAGCVTAALVAAITSRRRDSLDAETQPHTDNTIVQAKPVLLPALYTPTTSIEEPKTSIKSLDLEVNQGKEPASASLTEVKVSGQLKIPEERAAKPLTKKTRKRVKKKKTRNRNEEKGQT